MIYKESESGVLQREREVERNGSVSATASDLVNLWGKPQGLGGEIQTGNKSHPLQIYPVQ